MTKEKANQAPPEIEEQLYVDPNAPMHKRIIEQPINDDMFEFRWTRVDAAELIYVLAGRKQSANDSVIESMRRMLLRTVDPTQKGLLLDLLNKKSNYTLTRNLIEGMLPLITDNETVICGIQTSLVGDIKHFTVSLATDGQVERFEFKTDRSTFDAFQLEREAAENDAGELIHNFLSGCLNEDKQRQRYNLLVFDERNFTLPIKIYTKANSFLARNQDIIVKPTLKK